MPQYGATKITEADVAKWKQKCLQCFSSVAENAEVARLKREAEVERLESQRQAWVRQWQPEAPVMGYHQFYAFPSRLPSKRLSVDSRLEGTYELIYTCYNGNGEMFFSRSLHNCFLKFQVTSDGGLEGRVEIDKSIATIPNPYHDIENFIHNLTLTEGEERKDFNVDFSVIVEDEDFMEYIRFHAEKDGSELPYANISTITEHVSLPSLLKEREEDQWPENDEDELQEFNSEEEIDYLMQLYEEGNGSSDWLCRHKGLPAPIAKHIHDFVVWKPCPVLWFRPGDLLLDVTHFHDPLSGQYFVARKVST